MKQLLIALVAVILGVGVAIEDADAARRMGGGGNTGMQRSQPIKRDAAPTQNTAPSQNAAQPARPAQPAAQPSGMGRWLGPLAGLAAGIGLAALLSHLGLGETFASILMLLLIAAAVVLVIRFLMRRMRPQAPPVQYAGMPASAPMRYDTPAVSGGATAPVVAGGVHYDLPADFDAESFVRHAKLNFVRLQAANDAGDMEDIRQFTTPEMFAEIKLQRQERGAAPQKTDVVTLDVELLDFATEFRQYVASVRFFGTIRDTADGAPEKFDEIWHITKPADGSRNWAIAGIQQTN